MRMLPTLTTSVGDCQTHFFLKAGENRASVVFQRLFVQTRDSFCCSWASFKATVMSTETVNGKLTSVARVFEEIQWLVFFFFSCFPKFHFDWTLRMERNSKYNKSQGVYMRTETLKNTNTACLLTFVWFQSSFFRYCIH